MKTASLGDNLLKQRGSVIAELVVAISLLTVTVIPFAYSFLNSERLMRQAQYRAVAMEVVDGEVEVLALGGLSRKPEGESLMVFHRGAATSLPKGQFVLVRRGNQGALEWKPERPLLGGAVRREFQLLGIGGAK